MKGDRITLSMGAGGRITSELIESVFMPAYGNETLRSMDDAAELDVGCTRLAYTTDSYTIKPIFFPGGDIGKLSICGTVNDVSVKGAKPLAVSVGFILEEGFPLADLRRIVLSMRDAAVESGVTIATGDTKVVSKGEADGIFINTSGIGVIYDGMKISSRGARPGDDILISGFIADHGISIMNAREGLGFEPEIRSDVASLVPIVERIAAFGDRVHAMRDPTRGGLASVLNEISAASRVTMVIDERVVPVRDDVATCCGLLGLDPLYVANEGKVVIFSDPAATAGIIDVLKSLPMGRDAVVIGKVEETPFAEEVPPVSLVTRLGTRRYVPPMEGEALPRIC